MCVCVCGNTFIPRVGTKKKIKMKDETFEEK